MHRRTLLKTISAGTPAAIAGCTTLADLGGNEQDDEPGDVLYPEVSVVQAESHHEEVSLSVEVTQRFSEDHPALLTIERTNETDEYRRYRMPTLSPTPFSYTNLTHDSGDYEVFITPIARTDQRETGCWQYDGSSIMGGLAVRSWTPVKPGETIPGSLAVVAKHADADSESSICIVPGEYSGTTQFQIEQPDGEVIGEAELTLALSLTEGQ